MINLAKFDGSAIIKSSNVAIEPSFEVKNENEKELFHTSDNVEENTVTFENKNSKPDVVGTNVYAQGKYEIAQQIEHAKYSAGLILHANSFYNVDTKTIEEEYIKEHPEYGEVKAKFEKMEEKAEKEISAKMNEWEKDNPRPVPKYPKNYGPNVMDINVGKILNQDEIDAYQEKFNEQKEKVIKEYRQNNSDYDYLKSTEEKISEQNKGFLGIITDKFDSVIETVKNILK